MSSSTGIQCIISHTVVSWPASVSASTWNPIPFRTPSCTYSVHWLLAAISLSFPYTQWPLSHPANSFSPDNRIGWSVGGRLASPPECKPSKSEYYRHQGERHDQWQRLLANLDWQWQISLHPSIHLSHMRAGDQRRTRRMKFMQNIVLHYSPRPSTNTPLEFFLLAPSANVQCTIKMFQRERCCTSTTGQLPVNNNNIIPPPSNPEQWQHQNRVICSHNYWIPSVREKISCRYLAGVCSP